MKRLLILLLMILGQQLRAENAPSAFEAANRLYFEGKFSEAATTYGILEQSGQKSAALYFNWGNALFKSGKLWMKITSASLTAVSSADPRGRQKRPGFIYLEKMQT